PLIRNSPVEYLCSGIEMELRRRHDLIQYFQRRPKSLPHNAPANRPEAIKVGLQEVLRNRLKWDRHLRIPLKRPLFHVLIETGEPGMRPNKRNDCIIGREF